jgi:hypothetical protein
MEFICGRPASQAANTVYCASKTQHTQHKHYTDTQIKSTAFVCSSTKKTLPCSINFHGACWRLLLQLVTVCTSWMEIFSMPCWISLLAKRLPFSEASMLCTAVECSTLHAMQCSCRGRAHASNLHTKLRCCLRQLVCWSCLCDELFAETLRVELTCLQVAEESKCNTHSCSESMPSSDVDYCLPRQLVWHERTLCTS